MLFHHFSALSGIHIYLNKTDSGCAFACALGFMEITNPLLQARWFVTVAPFNYVKYLFLIYIPYTLPSNNNSFIIF